MENNFSEFKKELRQRLQKNLGSGYRIAEKEMDGINGTVKHSLMLIHADKDIHPCVNLDAYYKQYESGADMDVLIGRILESCREEGSVRLSAISNFTHWEEIKPSVYGKLINTEKNRSLLRKIPSRPYMDLSFVYYVRIESILHEECAVIQINNEHMSYWGVDEATLWQSAWENMLKADEAVLEDMADILSPFFCTEEIRNADSNADDSADSSADCMENISMYILSNRRHINGAVQMCNRKALREAAKAVGDDLWILPSSVHEVILLPVCQTEDCAEGLAEVVKEINDTQVEPYEILSYHVYHYSRKSGEITIAV